ncbi:hypothetical protein [Sphingobacterium corticibacter]|uniref:Porin n=1 Tax=Sphingobacterium corticibacter TaxID=2171749 RepID=A0A2T8HM54_9SPHI|nr:hypothetical protein [Sphingobacterium corticibacter]PVH26507.1 hypothetical protein DC487_02505 [Sphingobacterium corticibacter]
MSRISFLILLLGLYAPSLLQAQIDSSLFKRVENKDSLKNTMNMDAVYNRPMLFAGRLPVSIGGYMEANWQHIGVDGVSEGHQFQFRRFTIFMASTISKRIKFMSELEFEDGTREISIEFAALDMEFDPLLNLRGGIILNPIGSFNQNHDGPKWEFTDRPISATQMLPATWSNAGFGLYGKRYSNDWMFGYEAYISGGFDNTIIDNEQGKTYLPATKSNADRFEESLTGHPLYSGKFAVRNNKIGELGLSYMGGVYNRYMDEGEQIDDKRKLNVFAVDFNTTIPRLNTFITGEWAWINIQVPENYIQKYGNRQYGGFVDIVQPIWRRSIFGWDNASINLACRLEYVDWNVGRVQETGDKIGEDLWSVVGGLSFRPNSLTILRLNYRHQRNRDFLANPPVLLGGFSFGISTYF